MTKFYLHVLVAAVILLIGLALILLSWDQALQPEVEASAYVVSGESWEYQYDTMQRVTFIRVDGWPDCIVSSGNSPGISCNWDKWNEK